MSKDKKTQPTAKSYAYEVIEPGNRRRKGRMTANSRFDVITALRSDGGVPVSVTEAGGGMNTDIGAIFGKGGVKYKYAQAASFARRLSHLLGAGISLGPALAGMAKGASGPEAEMISDLAAKVADGVALSEALEQYPRAFSEVFVAYIQTAEQTGTLAQTSRRLAEMLERRASLDQKISQVTAYPKMVAGAIGLLVLGILLFLVPTFAGIYDDFGAELPAPTQALVNISRVASPVRLSVDGTPPFVGQADSGVWFSGSFPFISTENSNGDSFGPNLVSSPINFFSPVLWILLFVFALRRWLKAHRDDPAAMARWGKVLFRMPLTGKLIHSQALFRWSTTLASALETGLRTDSALELAGRSSGNDWLRLVSTDLAEGIRDGETLTEMLADPDYERLFPQHVQTMVSSGEDSGDVAGMLASISTATAEDIDTIISTLGAKIEVALLIFLGVVVGGMVIVLYLPIMNLVNAIDPGGADGTAPLPGD